MCNDSIIRNHNVLGRPTEGALIALAMKVKPRAPRSEQVVEVLKSDQLGSFFRSFFVLHWTETSCFSSSPFPPLTV